ncbi:hypothetical protein FWH09_00310, partial [Candidatus Saccharibacteria bacterium]|nr:hypothetical protein [Candidatus Saccharibacteria bacterium]
IRAEWDRFVEAYERTMPLYEEMVPVFSAWHQYMTNQNALPSSIRDIVADDYTRAARPLVDSGHEVLRKYGEQWAELSTKRWEAWVAFDNASIRDSNYSALRDAYNAADRARADFIRANRPDMNTTTDTLGSNLRDSEFNLGRFINDAMSTAYGRYLENEFLR